MMHRSVLLLGVAILFFISPAYAQNGTKACFQLPDCGSCLANGCGYCGSTNKCYPLSNSSLCAAGWQDQACAACYLNTDCDSCVNDNSAECGWCGATATCHLGNAKGPADSSSCIKAWQYESCTDCSQHSYCAQCFLDDDCSWQTCNGTDQCMPYGPSISQGCQVVLACVCSGYDDCEGCLIDDNCAWCGSNNTCLKAHDAQVDPTCGTVNSCKLKGFDAGSFVGGIFLGAGLLAIAAVFAVIWYRRRRQQSYEVLSG